MAINGWANTEQAKIDYLKFCEDASKNDDLFRTFKTNPAYQPILEHVDLELGKIYLEFLILTEILSWKTIEDCCKLNDSIGSPNMYRYELNGNTESIFVSPTSLRYLYTLYDMVDSFGINDGWNIVEIGGGYGGQCLMLSEAYDFESYTILDQKGPTMLQNRFIQEAGIPNARAMTLDEYLIDFAPVDIDLVISNYALTELEPSTFNRYYETIVNASRIGYFTCNPGASEALSANDLRNYFAQEKGTLTFKPDWPMKLSYPDNFVYTFVR